MGSTKNTQRQKDPPRKGVRADPLADRLFHRGGRTFVVRLRQGFVYDLAPLLLRIVDNSEIFLIFPKNM